MKQARPKNDTTKKGQIRNRYKNQRITKPIIGTIINNQCGLVLKIIFSFGKSMKGVLEGEFLIICFVFR